jgi:uncharacterized RDD family membrane protein YckC
MAGTPAMSQFGELAEWGPRAIAWLIDYAIVLGIFVVLYFVSIMGAVVLEVLGLLLVLVTWLASLAAYFYWGYLVGQNGQSPGMAIMGLKCVNKETGQVLGGGMGVVRSLAQYVNSIICYVGWFFPLWDAEKQTVGDKLMSTVVLANEPKKQFSIDLFKP